MTTTSLLSASAAEGTTYLAAPLDAAKTWIEPWVTGFIVLGAVILGGCIAWASIKMGARAAGSGKGEKGGFRDSIAAIAVILFAGVCLGGGLLAIGLAVAIGKEAPAVEAPAADAPDSERGAEG